MVSRRALAPVAACGEATKPGRAPSRADSRTVQFQSVSFALEPAGFDSRFCIQLVPRNDLFVYNRRALKVEPCVFRLAR
jgi:hypothetical protein